MSDREKLEFLKKVRSGTFEVEAPRTVEAEAVEPLIVESELDLLEKRLIKLLLEKLEKAGEF